MYARYWPEGVGMAVTGYGSRNARRSRYPLMSTTRGSIAELMTAVVPAAVIRTPALPAHTPVPVVGQRESSVTASNVTVTLDPLIVADSPTFRISESRLVVVDGGGGGGGGTTESVPGVEVDPLCCPTDDDEFAAVSVAGSDAGWQASTD